MNQWTSKMTLWLRGRLGNVKFLRSSYHWLKGRNYRDGPRKLARWIFVFFMAVIYFLLLTPYAVLRRYLPGGSPLRPRSGWNRIQQTTTDTGLFERMV